MNKSIIEACVDAEKGIEKSIEHSGSGRMKVPEFIFDIDMLVFSGEYKYSNVSLEAVEKLAKEIGYDLIRAK